MMHHLFITSMEVLKTTTLKEVPHEPLEPMVYQMQIGMCCLEGMGINLQLSLVIQISFMHSGSRETFIESTKPRWSPYILSLKVA